MEKIKWSEKETNQQSLERIRENFVFVLMGRSLLPNALRPFQTYCPPPNLGIART